MAQIREIFSHSQNDDVASPLAFIKRVLGKHVKPSSNTS